MCSTDESVHFCIITNEFLAPKRGSVGIRPKNKHFDHLFSLNVAFDQTIAYFTGLAWFGAALSSFVAESP